MIIRNAGRYSIKLQIWDTAGQERFVMKIKRRKINNNNVNTGWFKLLTLPHRFHSMLPMYYRGAAAALLVYDVTNPKSLGAVMDWINELKENTDDGLSKFSTFLINAILFNNYNIIPYLAIFPKYAHTNSCIIFIFIIIFCWLNCASPMLGCKQDRSSRKYMWCSDRGTNNCRTSRRVVPGDICINWRR